MYAVTGTQLTPEYIVIHKLQIFDYTIYSSCMMCGWYVYGINMYPKPYSHFNVM